MTLEEKKVGGNIASSCFVINFKKEKNNELYGNGIAKNGSLRNSNKYKENEVEFEFSEIKTFRKLVFV